MRHTIWMLTVGQLERGKGVSSMYVQAAVPRRCVARLRSLVATGVILGLLLSISFAGTAQAATTLNVGVGVGSGTVSGNA